MLTGVVRIFEEVPRGESDSLRQAGLDPIAERDRGWARDGFADDRRDRERVEVRRLGGAARPPQLVAHAGAIGTFEGGLFLPPLATIRVRVLGEAAALVGVG